MGQDLFGQKKTENPPKQYEGMEYLTGLLNQFLTTGKGAPQAEVPEMPYSTRNMGEIQGSVAGNMPQIQEFLQGLLRTGGINNDLVGQNLAGMRTGGDTAARDITRRVTGAMPLGSSAAVSALSSGLGDEELKNRLAMMDFLMRTNQTGVQNKLGAVGGMEALPSYIGAPGAIERAMIETRTPYDTANLAAKGDYFKTLGGLTLGSYYTPEMTVDPSMWQQLSPLLTALLKLIPGAAGVPVP